MKYYFITGSSSGLGKALAEEILKDNNSSVIGLSRHNAISHERKVHIAIDLSIPEKVKKFSFKEHISGEAEEICLVNNAGTIQPVKYLGEADEDDIISHYNLNVIAPALLSNLFIRTFRSFAGLIKIINISSGAGNRPTDGWSFYCSGKTALDMLTKVAVMEQQKRNSGLMVLSVHPGIVDTPMQQQIRSANKEDFSRVNDFIEYQKEGHLQSPIATARKLLQLINNLNENSDEIARIF